MDPVSGAASAIAVIEISAKIAKLCFEYSVAVKDAKKDIERLQKKVSDLENILGDVNQLLDGRDTRRLLTAHKLASSREDCLRRLEELKTQLDSGKTHKPMGRAGARALKWPFTSKQVEKIVIDLEKYEQAFIRALEVDQTRLILGSDQKMDLIDKKLDLDKLPIAEGSSYNSYTKERNARCLENTRVELRRHIAEWADDKNGKPLFWLNGMAGTGKSTIARTVAQSLADKGQLGASFFFKKGESDRGTAARFFTTIATDLMVRVPEMIPGIRKAIDDDSGISKRLLNDQFEKLILQPLSEIRQAPPQALKLVVVIDALDECGREEDIEAVFQFLARAKNIKPVSLRVFLTSRPELSIRHEFKQMSDGSYKDLILHEVPKQTIDKDIALFFEHELGKIRQQRSLSPNWPCKDQIQALVEMATPWFIFADTACRYIGEKKYNTNPKKRLDVILQYRPASQVSELDGIYLSILSQLFDDEDEVDQKSEFREIVGSIVVLESPLSIVSLAYLFGIPKDDISCSLDLLHSVLSTPVNEDMPIRLLHLSFRDFLLDPQKRGKHPFWVDERETHERLTNKCLQLMSNSKTSKGLRQNMCNLLSPGTLRSEIDKRMIDFHLQPEIQYACRYWVYHLEQSKSRIRDGDPVCTFLQKYFLYWLEAMSLIGDAPKSIGMIKSLQLLTDSDKSAEILDFLRDAKRFALRNRSILEDAPLQLYFSALIFAPEMSIIRKRFNSNIPRWITRLSKMESNWNASLQTLEGHSKEVNAVAFSPDGQLIASGSNDDTVRLWDTTTGSYRSTLEDNAGQNNAVAFSPDSQLLASGSRDFTIRLWDTTTGSCRSTLKGHTNWVNAVVFSPDGQLIASGSSDSTIRLWNTTTGSCRSMLKGHTDSVRAVAFSPDGQLIASGSSDYTVRLWDTTTGSCRSTHKRHTGRVNAVAFSPNSQLLASGSFDSTVRLWDTTTGSCRSTLKGHTDWVNAVAFSPNSQLIASGSNDYTVRLWDTTTESCRSTLKSHTDWVKAVAFSPDGQLIASGSNDYTVRLWDTTTGSCRSTLKGHTGWVKAVAFSPDSQLLASGSFDSTVRLWDTTTGSCRSTIEGHSKMSNAVAFSPDGQLLASGSYDSMVQLWDATTGSCRSMLKGHTDSVCAVAFSPDGQLIASGSNDYTVGLWDATTGSCRSMLEGHTDSVCAVAFSPDGQLIASGSNDYTVGLWDATTGSCRSMLEGHSGWVKAVAFSPDGQLIASGSSEYTVRLWDTTTGSCRSTLKGHTGWVNAVAFSPDGQLIASGSNDYTVRLWDTTTGSCRSTLNDHTGVVRAVAFSPDGSYLLTNKGEIPLPSHLYKTSSYQKQEQCNIFAEDQWVTSAEQRLLWLPQEYRPSSPPCTAVSGNLICLGHTSGLITILKVDLESIPSHENPI